MDGIEENFSQKQKNEKKKLDILLDNFKKDQSVFIKKRKFEGEKELEAKPETVGCRWVARQQWWNRIVDDGMWFICIPNQMQHNEASLACFRKQFSGFFSIRHSLATLKNVKADALLE